MGTDARIAQIEELADLLNSATSAVALTGAGISVPSGIPDFRSPGDGVWRQVDPMEVAHISVWREDPERFWSFYRPRFGVLGDKQPNGAHRALAELERRGLIEAVITQNIDRLHAKAGSAEVVEVHGSIETSSCLECGASYSLAELETRFDQRGVPLCSNCSAPLKPNVVLFGEMLPETALSRAFELAERADLLLAIGSSLEVQPVASLPGICRSSGGKLAILTKGKTPYDDQADVRLDGDVETELESLLAALS